MMKLIKKPDLRVRREITFTIEGPIDLVHDLSTKAMTSIPFVHVPGVRSRLESREDFLDENWEVIPGEQIVAAARRLREEP